MPKIEKKTPPSNFENEKPAKIDCCSGTLWKVMKIVGTVFTLIAVAYSLFQARTPPRYNPSTALSQSPIASFRIPGYCILPSPINSMAEFQTTLNQQVSDTKTRILNRTPYNIHGAMFNKNFMENNEKIVYGVCPYFPVQDNDLFQPSPGDYFRFQKTVHWVDKVTEKSIDTYTPKKIQNIICGIYQRLTYNTILPCNNLNKLLSEKRMRSGFLLKQNPKLPPIQNPAAVVKFLERHDPSALQGYRSMYLKFQDKKMEQVVDEIKKLNAIEKKFVKKYQIEVVNASKEFPIKFEKLCRQVVNWITKYPNSPFEIASRIYIFFYRLSPFTASNQQTAWLFMNTILAKMGISPILFPNPREVQEALEAADRDGNYRIFRDYLLGLRIRPIPTDIILQECVRRIMNCSDNLEGRYLYEKCNLSVNY